MRSVVAAAALVAMIAPAAAQQQRPPAQQRPQQAQPQPPAPQPGMFPCRTATEVCHIGVVQSGTQVMVLYSSAPQGLEAEGKSINVQGADLAPNVGRVVMLTGEMGQGVISGAQVVDVATPLLSFLMKQGAAGDDAGPAPKGPPPRQAPRR